MSEHIYRRGIAQGYWTAQLKKNKKKHIELFIVWACHGTIWVPSGLGLSGFRASFAREKREPRDKRETQGLGGLFPSSKAQSENKNWGFHMFSSIIMTCQTKSCLRSTVNTVALLQEANKTSAKEDRSGGLEIESSAWEMRVLDLFYLVLQCLAVLQLWNHSLKGLNYCPTASVLWFSGKYRHSWFPTKWRCGGFHRLHCTSFCVKPLCGDACIQSQEGRQKLAGVDLIFLFRFSRQAWVWRLPRFGRKGLPKAFSKHKGMGGDSHLRQLLESCIRDLITAGPRDEPPSPLQMLWPEYAFTKALGICFDCHRSLCTP